MRLVGRTAELIQELAKTDVAPEMLMEDLADELSGHAKDRRNNGVPPDNRTTQFLKMAAVYCLAASRRMRQELPGGGIPKDFPGQTIGERAAERITNRWTELTCKHIDPTRAIVSIAQIIDLTITDATCNRMMENWKKA